MFIIILILLLLFVFADCGIRSCVDSILINGKGSVFCPGVDHLINYTSEYMKLGLYPRQVNDKGYVGKNLLFQRGPLLTDKRPKQMFPHGAVDPRPLS